jgi:hypothetical protein
MAASVSALVAAWRAPSPARALARARGSAEVFRQTAARVAAAIPPPPPEPLPAFEGAPSRTFRGDAQRRHRSPLGGTDGVHGGPIVDARGNLYFGAHDHKVYALDASGRLRWSVGLGADVDAPLVLGGSDLLHAGTEDGRLHAIYRGHFPHRPETAL